MDHLFSRVARQPSRRGLLGAFLPLMLSGLCLQNAAAEPKSSGDEPEATSPDHDNSKRDDSFNTGWRVLAGVGVINMPRYPGSRFDYTRAVPVVSVRHGRFFLGGAEEGAGPGIGAYFVRTERWTAGAIVGGDVRKPRYQADDPVLQGWGDIPGGVRGGLFGSYSQEWLTLHAVVTAGAHHQGVLASLYPELEFHPLNRLTLSVGPQVSWANDPYMMTFFGINTAQSRIAGRAPYSAKSGVEMVSVKAGARYRLTDHWVMAVNLNAGRLQGDAANSPVTTDKTVRTIAALALYAF